ncbi:two-component regulator propeller domain-containing protein [Winogradskyella endarachnes]|uniref:histidine kinase n=1 Tax=Winogradskyella endarachnes TaxID=2681965 RepID=A0A6L6UA04_9FLAO|nr:two-component regulator propeller domain-containing protein [Winogradskyella endarachnes]MUU79135.1 response regulator [Winogradskyella endarachnes]
MKIKYRLFIFLLCFINQCIWSQEPLQKYDFVSIKEGISKVGVYTIIQDNLGFIWLGTNGAGLYRYDGINYSSYKYIINDSTSLSSSLVQSSYLDSKNRLWFGTDNGLNYYNRENDYFNRIPNSLFHLNHNSNISINSLMEDKNGNLFIGTLSTGLFKMNAERTEIERIISKESIESIPLNIKGIQIDNNGKIYIATDRGLKEYDYNTNTLKPSVFITEQGENTVENAIESLIIDVQNNIWVGTETDGLIKVSSNQNNNNLFTIDQFHLSSNQFLSLVDLKNGTILCGTENDGLYHIENNGTVLNKYEASKTDNNSILSNSIWSLYIDNNERIWLGYYNQGVSVYDKLYDKFNEINSLSQNPNSLQHVSVTAIVQDENDKLWIAMDGGGIDVLDRQTNNFTHINSSNKDVHGLTSDYIEALLIDSNQNIWAGSWEKGLFYLKKGSKKFVNYRIENTNNLASNTILTLAEDANGIIWIGSYTNGLYSYNPKTKGFTHYNSGVFAENGISNIEIRKVIIDKNDNIWIGTEAGLYKIKKQANGKFSVTDMRNKMPENFNNHNSSDNILSLFESTDGNIWIGTRGAGMCKYNPDEEEFIWYNKLNNLVEENVNSIEESADGNIWIAGNSGITKLNVSTNTFTNYTVNDGLLSNDYNINSAFIDKDGLMYFGNFQGIDYFNPIEIKVNNSLPSSYLTDFKLFNESVLPNENGSPLKKVISNTDAITLTNQQSVFTIEYSSINHTRPEKTEYAYYLEGYETAWNYVGKKRSATYTNLDSGTYTFKLKSANNDGVWNESSLDLKITILPPWWKTIWAILSYILLFLTGLYLLNKITRNRIRDKQLVLNERNNRLLEKELNEKKLQFFTNISHEFRTPLSLIIGPLEDIIKNDSENLPERVKNKHNTIHKNTNRLYRLINELLDFRKLDLNKVRIKVSELNLVAFTKNVTSYFKEEAFIKNIHLSIDTDVQDIAIYADQGMLEKIIFNILSNAFKVTPEGGAITIDISSKEDLVDLPLANDKEKIKAIEISISDTGPGLKEEQIANIFERFYQVDNLNKTYYGGTGIGLEVVQNFVKLHKGKIKVTSELGVGTTFTIILPAGNACFSETETLTENVKDQVKQATYFIPKQSEESTNNHSEEDANVSSRTLLIVEDNTELRNYLKNELKSQYKILLAKNGKEGLQMAKEVLPDIIMTDVIMPEMDGFQFCKHIKSDIKTSHIPLLMLTAKTTIENRMEGIENGADAYMVKPFDMGLLKLRLSQLITSRQLIFNKYFNVISDVETKNTTSMDKEFIEKVLSFINESIGDPDLNVESLASQLNLSRSQFYRKIKALTNQTANEFIRNIRLLKAKQMIEMGNSNISEVCYKVGFSSPSYFTKCFKSYFGILPKEIEIKTP